MNYNLAYAETITDSATDDKLDGLNESESYSVLVLDEME